jgi:peroxiredoxin/mono/diheme cytochrome c family protein
MTQNGVAPADDSLESVAAHRRVRGTAKLLGAIGLAVAGCALAYHSMWSFRDEWGSLTASSSQMRNEIEAENDKHILARGIPLYAAHCMSCHGAAGHGDGPALIDARQRPRDLASESWRLGADRASVRRAIEDGITHKATPALARILTSADLDSVVDYVLSLKTALLVEKTGLSPGGGAIAPQVTFHDSDGISGTLEQYRGKVVVVAFWGTTCTPCRKELPELARLAKRLENFGLVVLAICLDETNAKTASEVAASIAPGLRVYVDHDGSSRNAYEIRRLPVTFIIDREGRIAAWSLGTANWAEQQIEEFFRSLGVSQ